MGNCRRALQMIMEELEDVGKAIEFAKEQDDAELWEDLISYSIDKPRMKVSCWLLKIHLVFIILCLNSSCFVFYVAFITGLLNNIGTHVDPILLINRIKEGMEIPNLRDSLVKILQDYNLQVRNFHLRLMCILLTWNFYDAEIKSVLTVTLSGLQMIKW